MTITTLTSREFNQDTGRAKNAASQGPVVITDRGGPAQILLGIDENQRITGSRRSIADALGWPDGVEDIDIKFPHAGELPRAVDLS